MFFYFLHLLLHLIFTAFVFLQKYFSQNFYKAFTYFSNKHLVNHGKRLAGLTAWVIFIWFYLRSSGWCGSTPPYFDDIFSFLYLSWSTPTSCSFPLNAIWTPPHLFTLFDFSPSSLSHTATLCLQIERQCNTSYHQLSSHEEICMESEEVTTEE